MFIAKNEIFRLKVQISANTVSIQKLDTNSTTFWPNKYHGYIMQILAQTEHIIE